MANHPCRSRRKTAPAPESSSATAHRRGDPSVEHTASAGCRKAPDYNIILHYMGTPARAPFFPPAIAVYLFCGSLSCFLRHRDEGGNVRLPTAHGLHARGKYLRCGELLSGDTSGDFSGGKAGDLHGLLLLKDPGHYEESVLPQRGRSKDILPHR